MRITHVAWWCHTCKTKNEGNSKECFTCQRLKAERYAQVRQSDRSVVYYNPATGEHRTPARADQPVPEVYAAQGFERREIQSMIEWEREAGVVHEATNFHPGNEDTPLDPRDTNLCPPETKQALIEDMREAFNSGPWTGDLSPQV